MLAKTRSGSLFSLGGDTLSRVALLAVTCLVAMAALAADALAAQPPVGLGTAKSFAVLSGTTVTNVGFSTLNGDLGVTPGSALTGFPPGIVNGTVHATDPVARQAQADVTAAYNDAAGRTPPIALPADVGGMTLTPGVHKSGAALGLTGTLTLDGQGDPNAVFIFQIGSALTTSVGSHMILVGRAQASNVFWQIGSSATLGTSSDFAGTILALSSISMNSGVTLNGRALARNGAVTLINDTITSAPIIPPGGTPLLPGVYATAGGWLHYTNTVTASNQLTNATTSTLTGTVTPDGTCDISSGPTAPVTDPSADQYEEEVAFNASTCQSQVVSGTLTPLGAATLDAQDAGTETEGTTETAPADAASASAPSLRATSTTARSTTSATAKAAAVQYQRAYVKTQWIDPVFITITSLVANFKWPLYGRNGTLTGRVNAYKFPLDGWSSTGPSRAHFGTLPRSAGWTVRYTDHFTNNDFAAFVYATFGPVGFAACGLHFKTTAHFGHDETVFGYKNNSRDRSYHSTKSGACSGLVHHRARAGFGWKS